MCILLMSGYVTFYQVVRESLAGMITILGRRTERYVSYPFCSRERRLLLLQTGGKLCGNRSSPRSRPRDAFLSPNFFVPPQGLSGTNTDSGIRLEPSHYPFIVNT